MNWTSSVANHLTIPIFLSGIILFNYFKFLKYSLYFSRVETSLANRFPYTEKKDSNNFEKKSDNDTKVIN